MWSKWIVSHKQSTSLPLTGSENPQEPQYHGQLPFLPWEEHLYQTQTRCPFWRVDLAWSATSAYITLHTIWVFITTHRSWGPEAGTILGILPTLAVGPPPSPATTMTDRLPVSCRCRCMCWSGHMWMSSSRGWGSSSSVCSSLPA